MCVCVCDFDVAWLGSIVFQTLAKFSTLSERARCRKAAEVPKDRCAELTSWLGEEDQDGEDDRGQDHEDRAANPSAKNCGRTHLRESNPQRARPPAQNQPADRGPPKAASQKTENEKFPSDRATRDIFNQGQRQFLQAAAPRNHRRLLFARGFFAGILGVKRLDSPRGSHITSS